MTRVGSKRSWDLRPGRQRGAERVLHGLGQDGDGLASHHRHQPVGLGEEDRQVATASASTHAVACQVHTFGCWEGGRVDRYY